MARWWMVMPKTHLINIPTELALFDNYRGPEKRYTCRFLTVGYSASLYSVAKVPNYLW